ncbi:hypothetical protein KNP414_06613 [Paenibacillus mucilaginosus KNP414]|uniref:Uncharacterized protein n=1 Tax=Paenibacillus mucilaginosus (strain KNP414) TaxID=1036673 RepID=F8F7A9_PAEMK|nr:hypothetical protein KNP414_06613 [Paenibacillus mucilaginosus KNP414]
MVKSFYSYYISVNLYLNTIYQTPWRQLPEGGTVSFFGFLGTAPGFERAGSGIGDPAFVWQAYRLNGGTPWR